MKTEVQEQAQGHRTIKQCSWALSDSSLCFHNVLSAVFLSFSLKNLNLGMAYAMWTGFGIVGTSVLGVFLFQEKLTVPQVLCVLLIVVGIVGLRVLAKE